MNTSELLKAVAHYAAIVDALVQLATSKPIQGNANAGLNALQIIQAA